MKNIIATMLILFNFNAFSQRYEVGDEMYVIAEGGLNLRKTPNLNGEIIRLIKKGSKVKVEKILESEAFKLSNGYSGKWVKIDYENKSGYVFDAYLSRLSPIDFLDIDENGCWTNDILKDLAVKIGTLDSLEYDRYGDGEGTYRMVVYLLKDGGKYVEHFYWEHLENEIQLFGLSEVEIDQFVRSIMNFCKNKRDISVGSNRKYIDISVYEDCCLHNLVIKIIDDKLIIRTRIDPGS